MTKRYTMIGSSLLVISSLIVASVIIIMTIAAAEQQTSHAQVKQSLSKPMLQEFAVPSGSRPHDVAPAPQRHVRRLGSVHNGDGRGDPAGRTTVHHLAT